MGTVTKVDYRSPERLADVMALIQALALAEDTKRSEDGLSTDLQRSPRSDAETWTQVAEEHPEFFRVRKEDAGRRDAHRVSLVARACTAKKLDGHRDPLPTDLIGKLLDIAISLYDRERTRKEQWKSWLPIVVAIVTGLFVIAGAILAAFLTRTPATH